MVSYKVLIVDDEEIIKKLLVSLLSKHGHHCETAKNGLESLVKMKDHSFDAVITDIVMPQMDGITLTKKLANSHPDLPIMIMTGHAQEHSAGQAIAAGAREFIKKPFPLEEFTLRFDKMMRDQSFYDIAARVQDCIWKL